MDYRTWEESVPAAITRDALWKVQAYRLALFAADIGWSDVNRLGKDYRTRVISDQLYRALGSISANIAKGYSRKSGREKARFYEYALGSARESRDWYYKGRHMLGGDVAAHRLSLMVDIIRLLLAMVPDQRARSVKEEPPAYAADDTPPTA